MPAYSHALAVAGAAAREAAVLLRAEFHRPGGPRGPISKCPADTEAEQLIRARLLGAFPRWSYLGEETGPGGIAGADHVWLVDPNDGTSAFQKGHRGAAVSIGLVHQGVPVLGVVLAHTPPVGEEDCFTWAEGCGPLLRNGEPVTTALPGALTASVSVAVSQDADDASATNARLCAPARFRCVPGIAYRLALVAAGECAAAVSVSHPCEWDLAGGHALLRAAGLDLFALGGAPVRYDADGRCGALDCVGGHPSVAASLCTRDWRSVKRAGEPVRMLRPRADRLAAHPALDRAQGVLLGQVCGDALGAQVEFESAASIARKYPGGVRTLADGGTHHTLAGQATDDSELALALARSLLARGRFDDDHVAAAYVAWAKSGPFDIGHTTSQALRGGTTATAVRIAANPGSTANGALMRVSPLGIFSHGQTPEQSADLARRDASLTHPNVVCADANAIFVASIAHAVRSACGATELHAFATQLAESLAVNADVREALRAATDTRLTDFPSRHPGDVRFSFFAAWRQLLTGNDAADALAEVVGQGRDSDTDAAIAGALFGAVHGAAAFPQQWREQVLTARALEGLPSVHRARPAHYWPVDLLILAEQLLVVGGRAG